MQDFLQSGYKIFDHPLQENLSILENLALENLWLETPCLEYPRLEYLRMGRHPTALKT